MICLGKSLLCAPQQDNLLIHVDKIQQIFKDNYDNKDVCKKDTITSILFVLTGTYEKIVQSTVAYFLMYHNPVMQQNLRDQITYIIVQDVMKIVSILVQDGFDFINTQEISTSEKIAYCSAILIMIAGMKLGIDKLQVSMVENKKDQTEETSYVIEKFG